MCSQFCSARVNIILNTEQRFLYQTFPVRMTVWAWRWSTLNICRRHLWLIDIPFLSCWFLMPRLGSIYSPRYLNFSSLFIFPCTTSTTWMAAFCSLWTPFSQRWPGEPSLPPVSRVYPFVLWPSPGLSQSIVKSFMKVKQSIIGFVLARHSLTAFSIPSGFTLGSWNGIIIFSEFKSFLTLLDFKSILSWTVLLRNTVADVLMLLEPFNANRIEKL